jgi:hypothetical protein
MDSNIKVKITLKEYSVGSLGMWQSCVNQQSMKVHQFIILKNTPFTKQKLQWKTIQTLNGMYHFQNEISSFPWLSVS